MRLDCPCCSKKKYQECCQPLHEGGYAENALALMRSRYSAYALGLTNYIMRTTHPENKDALLNKEVWKRKITDFSKMTKFERLEIVDFLDGDTEAYVEFIAYLRQGSQPMQLHEKSRFIKIGPQWLYKDAVFFN